MIYGSFLLVVQNRPQDNFQKTALEQLNFHETALFMNTVAAAAAYDVVNAVAELSGLLKMIVWLATGTTAFKMQGPNSQGKKMF